MSLKTLLLSCTAGERELTRLRCGIVKSTLSPSESTGSRLGAHYPSRILWLGASYQQSHDVS